jgi:hypothetical protein
MAALGCGGSAPETPEEQKSPQAGQDAMEKLKQMQAGTMDPAGGGAQGAMEKMKSMTKKGGR